MPIDDLHAHRHKILELATRVIGQAVKNLSEPTKSRQPEHR
jgi:hypothetical protein